MGKKKERYIHMNALLSLEPNANSSKSEKKMFKWNGKAFDENTLTHATAAEERESGGWQSSSGKDKKKYWSISNKVSKQETGGKQFTRIYLMALILLQAAMMMADDERQRARAHKMKQREEQKNSSKTER